MLYELGRFSNLALFREQRDLLKGNDLQLLVKSKFEAGLKIAGTNGNRPKVALILACQQNFDQIASCIDWDIPRTEGEVESFPGNFAASTQYALLKTGQDIPKNYELTNTSEWWKIIKDVLTSEVSRKIFSENFWRSPMIVRPRRGLPLQHILPFIFGDKPIIGVDLGAGLHVALPLLNSEAYQRGIQNLNLDYRPIDIQTGFGIDKQPRELEWAIASEGPGSNARSNVDELIKSYHLAVQMVDSFPFISASVFDVTTHIRNPVDFAFSSFLRHQLGTATEIQNLFRTVVGRLVKENGVWIDIGKEYVQPPNDRLYSGYDVDVYRIKNGTPLLIGTPFVLEGNQVDIQRVNTDFFK
ncbi:hypothetical protein A2773_02935 [Candidatus Gottesmanbacteria bacterium RIFCSPHIGHO2_01_FULL_39_10]|uniref:Uncharacterized protein n=1 Tax=Candidatus Gottesmanbacteria bacterium RIFCSPHIGHO2_01_FULL_39_10 TaxID=1798375 RepID=A0A1F5ZPJ9_9BACT|nr:MAG: hypothetical protein A2773_02935 [Candidatus Gottesmanbacteria bacterium RIFCSPHIGHO2_01_FULL_39_10]